MELTEFLIAFSIIMLMLSFITERAANFLKLYFQDKEISMFYPHRRDNKGKWYLFVNAKLKILAIRQPSLLGEKEREYRILTINIIIGILIATLVNANIFEIIYSVNQEKPELSIKGWNLLNSGRFSWEYVLGGAYLLLLLWSFCLMLFNRLFESEVKFKPARVRFPFWGFTAITVAFVVLDTNKATEFNDNWKYALKIIGVLCLILFALVTFIVLRRPYVQNKSRFARHIDVYKNYYLLILVLIVPIVGAFAFESNDSQENKIDFSNIIQHTLGFVITGIFLSLGSKFWHDLLDLLFKVKNTQQRLSENQTFTDYSSASGILALAETSQYDVAQQLYEEYGDELQEIEGFCSIGLNTVFDENSRLHKKMIEVEYTFPSKKAQEKLQKIIRSGSITIQSNIFYLKDYLSVLFTSNLVALNHDSEIEDRIKLNKPVCYAYNKMSPDSKGSFSLIKTKNGQIFAISNLHVFAADDEFKKFKNVAHYELENRDVEFVIGEATFYGKIVNGYQFGNIRERGIDFCKCEILDKPDQAFQAYQALIEKNKCTPQSDKEMKMFGATSKYVEFNDLREKTYCNVDYKHFHKELYLIKIATSNVVNVDFGDSGGLIHYYLFHKGKKYPNKGLLVAKSDNFAYMFRLKDPNI